MYLGFVLVLSIFESRSITRIFVLFGNFKPPKRVVFLVMITLCNCTKDAVYVSYMFYANCPLSVKSGPSI